MGIFSSRATPGPWFISYHAAWDETYPGAFMRGEMKSGGFCKGNVWQTATPEFDRKWFKQNGMKMPWRVRVVESNIEPGSIPIAGILGPGESVKFEIGFGETK